MTLRFETRRLLLRDIEPRDELVLVSYFAEPAAQSQILAGQRNPENIRKLVAATPCTAPVEKRNNFILAIELKSSGELVGICTLTHADPESTYAELGWHISQAHWGKGYATESGHEALRIAFGEKVVRQVHSDCFVHNDRMQRVFRRLGMKEMPVTSLSAAYRESDPIVRYFIDSNAWKSVA